MWDQRFSAEDYVYGKSPNQFFKDYILREGSRTNGAINYVFYINHDYIKPHLEIRTKDNNISLLSTDDMEKLRKFL